MSDENDKTRIQFSKLPDGLGSDEDLTDSDDKTRIAAPGASKKTSDSNVKEQDRRLAAEKKARQLEKRLAAIAVSKKANQAAELDRKNNTSDETPADFRESATQNGDDKTIVKTHDHTVIKPRAEENPIPGDVDSELEPPDDIQSTPTPDKTVFKSMPARVDGAVGAADPTAISAVSALEPDESIKPKKPTETKYTEDGDEIIKGRFVYEKVLGAGGMGVVYKAKDLLKVEAQDRDPYVAIKVLGDEFKAHPEAFIALQRESRKTQRIAHPNIVNVHDFDRDGDTVFMTMEFLDGRPLDQFISQYKSTGLPEDEAWKILEGISAALIYAHEQKIIHSDFKPGNIFVTNQGLAKVFDFGIARAVAKAEKLEESIDDKTVFDAGNLGALTPAYASLEMLEGETPDVRDDIYALGCIAYEMFTGNHPFNRVHANEAMRKKMKPKRIANISKRQWRAIEKALAFKREDRSATVEEFWQQITSKRGAGIWIAASAAILISIISALTYQIYLAPKDDGFSKDEIRSEIEREVLIGQNRSTLEELLLSKEFDKPWEKDLHEAYEILTELLGESDEWLTQQTQNIYQAYLVQIRLLVEKQDYARAREVLANVPRYSDNKEVVAQLLKDIEAGEELAQQRLEQEEKQKLIVLQQKQASAEQSKVQKQKNEAFDVAMDTVDKQLLCRSTMNMRDIDIAISKLRSLNSARYRKAEGEIVAKLSVCISKIGRSFPERAEEFKKRAQRIFPNNTIVANIKIEPKDPCDSSLAGLGSRGNRAICRDPLKDGSTDLGKGPALVVIPAKGSVSTFAIGKYEITVEDMNRFCEHSDVCEPDSGTNGKYPVTKISADTVKKYLQWLTSKSKRKYRLPSRSEWVYAARANSGKADSNRNCRLDSRGIKKGGVIIKASTGQQNPWGLINYLGNARELVSKGSGYLAMGGSYDTVIEECIVTKAEPHSGVADETTGFRVLREIESK